MEEENRDPNRKGNKGMPKTIQHNGCGGQLKLVNEQPVQAGSKPGSNVFLYQCQKCKEFVVIG